MKELLDGNTESQIEQKILTELAKWCRGRDAFFWKNVSSGFFDGQRFRKHVSPFAINGTSDVLGIVAGVFVAIEVKDDKGRTSDEQEVFIEKIVQCGGVAGIARTVDQALALAEEAYGRRAGSSGERAILKSLSGKY